MWLSSSQSIFIIYVKQAIGLVESLSLRLWWKVYCYHGSHWVKRINIVRYFSENNCAKKSCVELNPQNPSLDLNTKLCGKFHVTENS